MAQFIEEALLPPAASVALTIPAGGTGSFLMQIPSLISYARSTTLSCLSSVISTPFYW